MPAPTATQHVESARITRLPFERRTPLPIDLDTLAAMIGRQVRPHDTLIVGVTGSVAAGKTTLCRALAEELKAACSVEIMSTDSFLLTNEQLAERGISDRKGYPESYDAALLSGALQRVRLGPVLIRGYSHAAYGLDPALNRIIDRPQLLLVEGLGLSPRADRRDAFNRLDLLVYIDAGEDDLAAWYEARFVELWRAAETDASSFYSRFRSMTEAQVRDLARAVWLKTNLPNLREHIARARDSADILLRKGANHEWSLLRPSRASL